MNGTRTIKVKFADHFTRENGVKIETNSLGNLEHWDPILQALSMYYKVEFSEEPDFVFGFTPVGDATGIEYTKYRGGVKCQVITENMRPDFNCFDYAVGLFHDFKYEDRYCYIPTSVMSSRISYNCFNLMNKNIFRLTRKDY